MAIKTKYFQPLTINQTARSMLRRIESVNRLHHSKFDWQQSALLILDMQDYFLDEVSHAFIPSAPSIIEPLYQLAKLFCANNRPIILTQHINNFADAGQMQIWWRDLLTNEHPFNKIIPPFTDLSHQLIRKSQYDAFYQTPLDEMLHDLGVKQVVIGGVATHLCCETTARSAFQRGLDTFFLVDGTATYNVFYHQATLLNLSHGFATLTFCNDIQNQFPFSRQGDIP